MHINYQYSLGVAVVIKPLLRVAASSSNMLAALALSAISQLANNSSINQENLRRSGVNKLLMEKLLSEPRYEVEQATLAIFKMAQHNISVQNDFCQAGAVELLISILHNHSGTSKPKYAIAAIDALVEGRPDVQKACKDLGVIELLLDILRYETTNEETLHVVSALRSISKGNSTNQTALRQVNALPLFLQILNCQAAKYLELQRKTVKKLSETTICTMCCVFENNKENQCEFHRLGAVPVLIKLLSNGSPNEKLHAAAAIGLLAKNNTVIQDEAFHCGVVPHITIMVSSKSDLHCKHAVLAIQDLCSGNHKVQNSFQQLGCIKILVQLATTKKEINGIIADALGELAQDNWLNQNLVREEGGIELLFHIGNNSQLLKVLKHNKANQIFPRSKCNPTWIKVVQTEARLAKNHMTDFEALFCPALVEDERSFQKMIDSGHWISKMMSSNYLENEEFQWFQLLVRDLKNLAIPSSQLNKRIYATAAFYQLTFDHRKRQEYLEKTGIIALLVPMLSDTDSKLKTLAACTVSNLCFLRCSTYTIFKNQMLLMGALAIPPLLASIKSPRNVWCVRESAVAAVLNMAANNNQIQDLLTKQGALDLFISMLSSDVKRMARCGAAAVWILSEKNEATSALLNKMGAPKILFNLASKVMCGLEDQDLEVADLVVYASLAMSSLADAYVPCCEQLIGYGVLDMFCSILKHKNCSYRIRVIVSGTLKSFITGVDTGGLSDGVTNRLIKTLVALLSSIHMECRLHGALTLTSLLEFKGGLLKTAILEARVLPLIISSIRVDVGGYAAEAAARALSLLVHDNASGQEEVRTLGGVELLMIAAKQNLPAVDDNKPKSKLPFAAAEALESLCHHNDANTQAVKDGQEKEWRNLIDRVFTKPPDPKDKKNTAYSNARYHLRVLEDCSGNGASMSVLNDSSKEREPINNNTVHNGNGNSKGPCTQLAVESQNCYKKHTKQTLGVPQGPAQVLLFRAAASPGICHPRVRQDSSRNRFEGLEVETNDLEKETKSDLLKMQRALTKRLSEIRALALQDLLGGELDSQQREKVSKEASTASLLERVEEELQARSD